MYVNPCFKNNLFSYKLIKFVDSSIEGKESKEKLKVALGW